MEARYPTSQLGSPAIGCVKSPRKQNPQKKTTHQERSAVRWNLQRSAGAFGKSTAAPGAARTPSRCRGRGPSPLLYLCQLALGRVYVHILTVPSAMLSLRWSSLRSTSSLVSLERTPSSLSQLAWSSLARSESDLLLLCGPDSACSCLAISESLLFLPKSKQQEALRYSCT
jgi:hypothetical protein